MSEVLTMSIQEKMALLSFASKSAEMLKQPQPHNPIEVEQWKALAVAVEKLLGRLDREWPGMIAVPHHGGTWAERTEE